MSEIVIETSETPDRVEARREGQLNIFEFDIFDGDQALAAVLDISSFYSTGHVAYAGKTGTGDGWPRYAKWVNFLEAFVICGFPCSSHPGEYVPQIVQGLPGQVGAEYTCTFPSDENQVGDITMRTEVVRVVDREDLKEVVLRHGNIGRNVKPIDCDWVPYPKLPVPETETVVRIRRKEQGGWRFMLSFTGKNMYDPAAREGKCGYYGMSLFLCTAMPCIIPVMPCLMWAEFAQVPEVVRSQMERVRRYCNEYQPPVHGHVQVHTPTPVVASRTRRRRNEALPQGHVVTEEEEEDRLRSTNLDVAVPVAQVIE